MNNIFNKKKKINKYFNKLPNLIVFNIYKGKIINILEDYVIIDLNYKSEGIIPLSEFKQKKIKKGKKIDIIILNFNYNGYCLLSYKKAKKYKSWIKIQEAYNKQKKIKGYVISRTKGGFIINLFNNIQCFLPGSQIDIKNIKNYDYYVGKKIYVKILKINLKTKNIIVSHKVIIEKKIIKKKEKKISKLKVGQIVEGKIKNIISYGAFIDLGGIDGLLHITDISWNKKVNPSEYLKLGEKYNFIILSIDKENLRIQLGLKQLTTNPWDLFIKKIKKDSLIEGKVSAITDYGAFIEIEEGIEGLLHVSEMSWDNQLKSAKDFVKLNEKIKCKVISIDKDDKKIFLSRKKLEKDPWSVVIEKYQIGSIHSGKIVKILKNNYGLKIELKKNLYGILLNYDISWYYDVENLSLKYKIGEKIKFIILSIDTNMRKIYLGHKQLKENKWYYYKKIYKKKSKHKGYVVKYINNNVILKNKKHDFLNFVIPYRFLKKNNYKINEIVDFLILEVNEKTKKIIVAPYKNIINIGKSTFADLYELNVIKKQIEENEKI
ncbi:MAG: S1 RNA-binding domain-containing protein [Candidatus Shikimatogenerans bostrichidophilus]|nr:MAG: S1 RNA-binding domain-containing protein [Candidatus Shikimatogenerans bostrichidophilus]